MLANCSEYDSAELEPTTGIPSDYMRLQTAFNSTRNKPVWHHLALNHFISKRI